METSNTSPSPPPPPPPPPPPLLPPPPRPMQQEPFPPLSYAPVWARPPPLTFVTSRAWSPGNVAEPSRNSGGQPTTPGRHTTYRGARCRAGKWVSEIREPGKARRIWLGTYPKAEMAAVAYDVAALALKGADAVLNFPDAVNSYPLPASASPSDIQAAAAAAAAALPLPPSTLKAEVMAGIAENYLMEQEEEEHGSVFMDVEEIFNLPKLIESMAEGMLMTPPRMSPNDSPKASDEAESLWNYDP